MFGTLVALETVLGFATIPGMPLAVPAVFWGVLAMNTAVAAGVLWLLAQVASGLVPGSADCRRRVLHVRRALHWREAL
jgi:hypothetical protein